MLRMRRIICVLAAIATLVFGCSDKSPEQLADQSTDVPDEVVSDFRTSETDSGLVAWTLTAPKANRYNARKLFIMDNPTIEFFDEAGNLQTTLTSDFGEYYQDSRDMLAYGNVVVVSVQGDVLETDSLRYVTADDKIVSDSRVKLTRGKDVLTGIGLECDHRLNSVDIKKDVKAVIIEDENSEGGSAGDATGDARGSING
jgi:LPS export ABC transporter protein LptC